MLFFFFLWWRGVVVEGKVDRSFADQIIVLLVTITIQETNTFSSANSYDTNNLSFSSKNCLAITVPLFFKMYLENILWF